MLLTRTDNFLRSSDHNYVLKRAQGGELAFYERLEQARADFEDNLVEERDPLLKYTPRFYGTEEIKEETYLRLQDLTAEFHRPLHVMDCKMVREHSLSDILINCSLLISSLHADRGLERSGDRR